MRVALIGAGIIGVTTAYELAVDGHEVTVFERRSGVATEASFANAGVLAPGYVTPWAAPGMPWKVASQLFDRHAAVRLGGWGAIRQLPWMWRWWRACGPAVHARNRSTMQRLAHFSRERQQALTRSMCLDYEQAQGYLVLLRTAREQAMAQAGLVLLRELGVTFDLVSGARAREIEPGLNAATPLEGAIHLAQDGVGNCRQFTQLLKTEAQRLGVHFRFEHLVLRISPGSPLQLDFVRLRRAEDGEVGDTQSLAPTEFDAIVICAGHQANALLRSIGLRLPLAPVYGYSVTAPLRHTDGHPNVGPRSALMDEKYKVAISRLGQRVRVAGSAELGGTLSALHPAALRTLYQVLDDWFPGAAVWPQAQQWKGARPMLPDGPPVLCASGTPDVWLNLGHGSSGWALSCGCARVLADLLAGRPPPIDMTGLDISRLGLRA